MSFSSTGKEENILWTSVFFSWCFMVNANGNGNQLAPPLLLDVPTYCWRRKSRGEEEEEEEEKEEEEGRKRRDMVY